ncbi:MAG: hypothetical protein SPG13_00995 [Peptostreptococcus porci]|uniref:type II toxin-antitoxin system HicB family antitoxin n=1 Tax=Peptostreptococcus porci TaxID=2652282 RepID=UPI0018A6C0E0|nr:hypothetical protein [Peptostreptococcus porci]MDY5479015.1 hypothetical protein [Peptostreptococcus porci]
MKKVFTYPIVAREVEKDWIIYIPDFEMFGGVTQAKRTWDIRKMAADYIEVAIKELHESCESIPKASKIKDVKRDDSTDYRMYVSVEVDL